MTLDLTVFSPGNLIAAVFSGIAVGLYLVIYHPAVDGMPVVRRAFLQGWSVGFLLSVFYAVRIAVGIYRSWTDPTWVTDVPRVLAAWLLFVLFAVFVGVGAWLGYRWRLRRLRKRVARGRPDA